MVDDLFRELAIMPGACSRANYATETESTLCCAVLAAGCGPTTVVRDLRNGEWSSVAQAHALGHTRWLLLLKRWTTEGMLLRIPQALPEGGADDESWRSEALASHRIHPLTAVVLSPGQKENPGGQPPTIAMPSLPAEDGWSKGGVSTHLVRTPEAFLPFFGALLRQNKWCAFIDPYLDPKVPRYRGFGTLLAEICKDVGPREIEFHRWSCIRSKETGIREVPVTEWERRFRIEWQSPFERALIRAKVVLWPDLMKRHDRFIRTRRGGLLCGNGFDLPSRRTGEAPSQMTVACMSRSDSDRIWRTRDASAHTSDAKVFEFGATIPRAQA